MFSNNWKNLDDMYVTLIQDTSILTAIHLEFVDPSGPAI